MNSTSHDWVDTAPALEVWELAEVVATTWAVITACGWTPVTSTSPERPATRFLVHNALIGGPHFAQHQQAITDQIPEGRRRAEAMIPAIRRSLHPASTIGARLRSVVGSGTVHLSELPLPVTAVANQLGKGNARGLVATDGRVRSTNHALVGAVGERITVIGIVIRARPIRGFSRGAYNMQLIIDCGSFTAKLVAGKMWVYSVGVGDEISVSGIVRNHDMWDDQPQTELTATEPVAAAMESLNPGHPTRRRRAGVRRRFQNDANPAASARAQRTTP